MYSVITSRMNRIAGMDWKIVSDKQQEDKLYERLKDLKQICDEYKETVEMPYQIARQKLIQEIRMTMPDVLPDLSNFQSALIRWKRRIQSQSTDQADWIREWVMQPNITDKFPDFTKKQIMDLMVHGASATYCLS